MRLVKEKCNKMFEDIFDKQSGMKLFKYRQLKGGRERKDREKEEKGEMRDCN